MHMAVCGCEVVCVFRDLVSPAGLCNFGSVTESCDYRHDDHGDPPYSFSREYLSIEVWLTCEAVLTCG